MVAAQSRTTPAVSLESVGHNDACRLPVRTCHLSLPTTFNTASQLGCPNGLWLSCSPLLLCSSFARGADPRNEAGRRPDPESWGAAATAAWLEKHLGPMSGDVSLQSLLLAATAAAVVCTALPTPSTSFEHLPACV